MAKKIKGKDGKKYKEVKPFYKKWWFYLIIIIIIGGALGSQGDDKKAETNTVNKSATTKTESSTKESIIETKKEETKTDNKASAEEQYQSILDEYTVKIKEAVPTLVEEYNAEYPSNTNGLEGLAELSNEKIGKLAEISNEGISKMADVMYSSGSGSYEDYEAWAQKLMDVYMNESTPITDAYMSSAQ